MEGASAAGGHPWVHHVVRGCRGRAKGGILHVPGTSLETDHKVWLTMLKICQPSIKSIMIFASSVKKIRDKILICRVGIHKTS